MSRLSAQSHVTDPANQEEDMRTSPAPHNWMLKTERKRNYPTPQHRGKMEINNDEDEDEDEGQGEGEGDDDD